MALHGSPRVSSHKLQGDMQSCDIEFDLNQVTLSVILRGLHISSLRLIY